VKNLLITITATLACVGAFAQGKLRFDINSDNLIYITSDTMRMMPGDGSKTADWGLGAVPLPGSSLYAGPNSTAAALGGTWVVYLFGGTSAGTLSLQTTTSLADVSSQNFGGIDAPMNLTFAGLPAGTPAWFEINVSNGGAYAGQSPRFRATPQLSVYGPIYETQAPVNSTWTPGTQELTDYVANLGTGSGYFGGICISTLPEPGTFALVGLGAAVLMVFRRRR
jgi:hypothetical protein